MKSAFGIGAGIFLTPVLALVMDPKEAVMVVGIMMLLTDFTALYQYWGKWSKRDVWSLVPPALSERSWGPSAEWLFSRHHPEGDRRHRSGLCQP